MPFTGTLHIWNDSRGFGFIAPISGGSDVFVHVSAFPRDGLRPTVGERLTYELGRGGDGRLQAVTVTRLSLDPHRPIESATRKSFTRKSNRTPPNRLGTLIGLALLVGAGLVGAGTWAYFDFSARHHRAELAAQPAVAPTPVAATVSTGAFRCDGRMSCSQMTSCAEAQWFISHCAGTKMDGDNDGIPCEQQWCMGADTW